MKLVNSLNPIEINITHMYLSIWIDIKMMSRARAFFSDWNTHQRRLLAPEGFQGKRLSTCSDGNGIAGLCFSVLWKVPCTLPLPSRLLTGEALISTLLWVSQSLPIGNSARAAKALKGNVSAKWNQDIVSCFSFGMLQDTASACRKGCSQFNEYNTCGSRPEKKYHRTHEIGI